MKMISSIIRPERLEAVTEALDRQHIVGMTLTDVRGFGRQKGQADYGANGDRVIRFVIKVKVDVIVQDEDMDSVMAAVEQAAKTGNIGDGKIFVLDVPNAMRIRTGEKGINAL